MSMSQSTREQFLQDLKNAKDATSQAICEITAIKEKLEEHQKNVRISKTAGAVGGIVGTALLFTPAFFVGAAITAGAAATSIGAEIGDSIVSTKEGKNIFATMEKINEHNEKLNKHQENIAELAKELQKVEKMSEEDAYYAAWYWYTYKGINGTYKGAMFIFNTSTAVKYITASKVGRGALTLKEISSMPVKIGKYAGSTAREAFTTLRGLSIAGKRVLGVAAVVLDVYTIVDTWRTENPSLQSANETLDKLEMLEKDYSRKVNALSEM